MSDLLTNWETIDLRAADATLSPGDYAGTIERVTLHPKQTELWIRVEFTLADYEVTPEALMIVVAVADSKYTDRLAEAFRRLHEIAAACRVTLPDKLRPQSLPELFEGRAVLLRLAQYQKGGVTDLVVRKVLPSPQPSSVPADADVE